MWVAGGQAASVIGTLFSLKLVTNLVSTSEFGSLTLILTLATLVNLVVVATPLGSAVGRHLSIAAENGTLPHFHRAAAEIALVSAGAIVACGLLLNYLIPESLYLGGSIVAGVGFGILSGWVSVLVSLETAARNRRTAAVLQGLDPWVRATGALLAVALTEKTASAILSGYGTASVAMLVLYFVLRVRPSKLVERAKVRLWRTTLLGYAWPFSLMGVATWAQFSVDRIVLGTALSPADLGYFAAIYQLGFYPVTVLTGMVSQLVWPHIYKNAGPAIDQSRIEMSNRIIMATTLSALCIGVAIFVVLYLAKDALVETLLSDQYTRYSYLLPWMSVAGTIFAAAQTISIRALVNLKSRLLIVPRWIAAALWVASSAICILWLGVDGAVLGSVLGSLGYLIIMIRVHRRVGNA